MPEICLRCVESEKRAREIADFPSGEDARTKLARQQAAKLDNMFESHDGW